MGSLQYLKYINSILFGLPGSVFKKTLPVFIDSLPLLLTK